MAGTFPRALAYAEISQRAKDLGLVKPEDLDEFLQLLDVLDEEFLKLNTPTKK
jgi:hypothetical protein